MKRFVHRVKLELWSGKGGRGLVSFERKRFKPKGGPSGGDGGTGGSVILVLDSSKSDLSHLARYPIQKAGNGHVGGNDHKYGKRGTDLLVQVPENTAIFDESGEKLTDITKQNPKYVLLQGSKGGFGNVHFKNARNQAPYYAQTGEAAQSISITAQLTDLADILILGNTNSAVQKSFTLITDKHLRTELSLNHPEFRTHSYDWKQLKMMLLVMNSRDQQQATTLQEYLATAALLVVSYDMFTSDDLTDCLALVQSIPRNTESFLYLYCALDLAALEQAALSSEQQRTTESSSDQVDEYARMRNLLSSIFSIPLERLQVVYPTHKEQPGKKALMHRVQAQLAAKNDSW